MRATAKAVLGFFAACFALAAMAEDATVERVTVRQRWPWSRLADIDYVLSADPTQCMDVAVAAYNGSVPLPLPPESLSGDLYNVTEGARRIVLDPAKTAYTNTEVLTRFRVELALTPAPLYMIVDLATGLTSAERIQYVYEDALRAGAWGSVATNPVAGVESIIWTGLTNNPAYKNDKLVLRRIHRGSLIGGTVVDHEFYMGVFELTQGQRLRIMGNYNSASYYTGTGRDVHPEERISYNTLRGATNDTPSVNWPSTGTRVSTNSLLGVLAGRTGLAFDLPTSVQWEYACRAGTVTSYNSGSDSDAALGELGWYSGNSTNTKEVGLLKPNAWGLYDMHGNVEELCLDWFNAAETQRVRRNGSWQKAATYCVSTYQTGVSPTATGGTYGLRLALVVQ